MAWSFTADRPVYIQMAQRIREGILNGEYQPGDQIPSVRQLALIAAVNPNTVQHCFTQLESEGLLVARGTTGRFVTDDVAVIEQCRANMVKQLVQVFLEDARRLSVEKHQLIALIEEEDE